jgi:hypothetical protein
LKAKVAIGERNSLFFTSSNFQNSGNSSIAAENVNGNS